MFSILPVSLSIGGGGAPFVYNLKKIAQVYCVLILIDKHKGTKEKNLICDKFTDRQTNDIYIIIVDD